MNDIAAFGWFRPGHGKPSRAVATSFTLAVLIQGFCGYAGLPGTTYPIPRLGKTGPVAPTWAHDPWGILD